MLFRSSNEKQWKVAEETHLKLDQAGVKYSISLGNHDYDVIAERDVTSYRKYFPYSRYTELYGTTNFGSFDGTLDNTYHKFSYGGKNYMIVALEYGPRAEVVAWAKKLCDDNYTYNVIVTTHCLIDGDGVLKDDVAPRLDNGENPQYLWDNFIKLCPNVKMVLGGHWISYGVTTRVMYNDAGIFRLLSVPLTKG